MGKAVIAIHGGAGAISRAQMSLQQELRYIEALSAIVETGQKMLEAGESALDVVTKWCVCWKSVHCLTPELALSLRVMKPMNWTPV